MVAKVLDGAQDDGERRLYMGVCYYRERVTGGKVTKLLRRVEEYCKKSLNN